MFDELVARIEKLSGAKRPVVVGISGFAGAGKSTLADRLAKHFGISGGQIVRLDNLYNPLPRGPEMFDDYDWNLLTQILKDARSSDRLKYQGRGFYNEQLDFDEPMPKILIVEGIRLYRKELMEFFDMSVWIDCPPELALERAKVRDTEQGHDAEYMKRWDAEWAPLSQQYYETYHPEKLAHFLYKQYKS